LVQSHPCLLPAIEHQAVDNSNVKSLDDDDDTITFASMNPASRLSREEVARYKNLPPEQRQAIAVSTDTTRQWVWEVLSGRAKKTSKRAQAIIKAADKLLKK
jgi:hypothetical protein